MGEGSGCQAKGFIEGDNDDGKSEDCEGIYEELNSFDREEIGKLMEAK